MKLQLLRRQRWYHSQMRGVAISVWLARRYSSKATVASDVDVAAALVSLPISGSAVIRHLEWLMHEEAVNEVAGSIAGAHGLEPLEIGTKSSP